MNPLISVIIPMYQSEATIKAALLSVVSQSYRPFEVILVNDGSTDRSEEHASAFIREQQDPTIAFRLINQVNQGVSKARNVGMQLAKGTYIALLDADDEWVPNKIEKQVAIFQAYPDIDFLGTSRNGEHWKRWGFKRFSQLTLISARLLLYKTFFATPTVLFKRQILDTVGYFDETQHYSEDANYWIRICNDHQCALLNESLVITGGGKPHIGYSGLSSNIKAMAKGEVKNMRLGYYLGIVGKLEYCFLLIYCKMKYFRRLLVYRKKQA